MATVRVGLVLERGLACNAELSTERGLHVEVAQIV